MPEAPRITPALQFALRAAFHLAAESRHEFVTLEHLLASLVQERRTRQTLVACGADLQDLEGRLEDFLDEEMEEAACAFAFASPRIPY